MEKLIIKNSRWRFLLLLVGAVGFVVAGVAMILTGNWFGWVAVIFFGACVPVAVWQFLDARPRLVIDEHGVTDRTLGVGRIDWLDIESARVFSIHGNDFISLELRDPEKYRGRLSDVKRAMASANRRLGFSDFSLNLSGVQANTGEVFELVMKFCERARLEAEERAEAEAAAEAGRPAPPARG